MPSVRAVGAVAGGVAVDHHAVSRLHGIAPPALLLEPIGTPRLTIPIHDGAVRLLDVHEKVHVRVLPIDARYHAFEGDWFGRIELAGKRMVGNGR